jgi:hypothetical protein
VTKDPPSESAEPAFGRVAKHKSIATNIFGNFEIQKFEN